MAKVQSHHVDRARIKPEKAPRGELATSMARIGEPYTPRTPTEKAAWGQLVKDGLSGYLGIAEQMGATPEQIEQDIEVLGFKSMYAMSRP